MPIKGLSGRVRTPRWAIIRLGYKPKGKAYPRDCDEFVIKREGDLEIFEKIKAAYRATPIKEAEDGTYRLGRRLRMMFPWEFDAVYEGREVSFELLNRSWNSGAKLRCSGSGGDSGENAGLAVVRDEAYAERLKAHGLMLGEKKDRGRTAICHGEDCPLHISKRTEADKLPGCHREMRLQALLLHPQTDEQIAWVEVASGSFHGAFDVQSELKMLRLDIGRTAFVPFTLTRISHTITTPAGRTVKATLHATYDHGEAVKQVKRIAAERDLLLLAAREVTYDQVADIQPQPDRPALSAPAPQVIRQVGQGGDDADDAIEDARQEISAHDGRLNRRLSEDERRELKQLCGGIEGQPEAMERLKAMIKEVEAVPGWEGTIAGRLAELTVRHMEAIKAKINDEIAAGFDASEAIQGELVGVEGE